MSHHSNEFDPEISEETLKRFAKAGLKTDASIQDILKEHIGPTGKFPEGKLTSHDEGEIGFAVFHKDGKVIIDFGSQVSWLGMNPNQAIEIGNSLIKHGRKARKENQKC